MISWHENPLNLDTPEADLVMFSLRDEAIILVFIVSIGYEIRSTVSPASPPATPDLIKFVSYVMIISFALDLFNLSPVLNFLILEISFN